MVAVLVAVLLLLTCAGARPEHISDSNKMTLEKFRNIPNDAFSDPVDDIPKVPSPEEVLKQNMQKLKQGVLTNMMVPRDQYLQTTNKVKGMTPEELDERAHIWIDFPTLHDQLLEIQNRQGAVKRKPRPYAGPRGMPINSFDKRLYNQKLSEFKPNTFELYAERYPGVRGRNLTEIVWTTCDEFKDPSHPYDPHDIVNFDWIPFYSWSKIPGVHAALHRFQIPTKKQVYDYHTKFSRYMNRTVDWNKPKLYFERDVGAHAHKALLIAVDITGLYHCIWNTEISEFMQRNKLTITPMSIRIKVVGEYVALMYCDDKYATIMAREDHVPQTNKDKREQAKILKFKGKGRPITRNLEFEQERERVIEQGLIRVQNQALLPIGPEIPSRPIGKRRKNKAPLLNPHHEEVIPGAPV